MSHFPQQKGKISPDYQHCKWGGGEKLLRVPTVLSGIVDPDNQQPALHHPINKCNFKLI